MGRFLFSLASFLGVLGWLIFKVMDRKDRVVERQDRQAELTGGLSNGSLARLKRAEEDLIAIERRLGDEIGRSREDHAERFAELARRLDRWDERWELWRLPPRSG